MKTKIKAEIRPFNHEIDREEYKEKSSFEGGTFDAEIEYSAEELLAVLSNQKELIIMIPSLVREIKEIFDKPVKQVKEEKEG